MLLLVHIVTAIGSLVAASSTLFVPSKAKFTATYALTGVMLASGTILTIQHPQHLLESCVMGLALLSVIVCQLILAKKKAHENIGA